MAVLLLAAAAAAAGLLTAGVAAAGRTEAARPGSPHILAGDHRSRILAGGRRSLTVGIVKRFMLRSPNTGKQRYSTGGAPS